MDDFKIREKAKVYIQDRIHEGLSDYINKYENDSRYLLYYPLIDLEIGMREEDPKSITNWNRRATVAFLIDNIYEDIKNVNGYDLIEENGFEEYRDKLYNKLNQIMQDSRTLSEIDDGNSIAKSKIEEVSANIFKVTTSLVIDKYKEESFYFYGMDDEEVSKKDRELIKNQIAKFIIKYSSSKENIRKLKRLHIDIDKEVLEYCKSQIDKDLLKLGENLKSKVFKNINELSLVLSYLYYLAFINKFRVEILNILGNKIELNDYLLYYDKEWIISKISNVQSIPSSRVTKIINYLINNGTKQILEYPLFELNNHIITIPSLIMVNDWQFSIVNGHHYNSSVDFKNKSKTISVSTEKKIINKLIDKENIVSCSGKYYEFLNDDGIKINSDIDLGIYDIKRNKLLIAECKWKENHYYDNVLDKNYIKIQDTLNKIFKEQISKHKEYLNSKENINFIFDNNETIKSIKENPEILYIGIDKRNQIHIEGKHMITEFMLAAFIDQYSNGNDLNLELLFREIETLETKVEYYSIDDKKVIKIDDDTEILIDKCELNLNYTFNE